MSYRILVTSSRTWWDFHTLTRHLGDAVEELGGPGNVTLVHGACPDGGDAMTDEYGRACAIRLERHPAQRHPMQDFGRWPAAGPRRNAYMVSLGARLCLAFLMPCTKADCAWPQPHESHGASHCADLAEKAGIETRRYRP